jgi:hypothetical protein
MTPPQAEEMAALERYGAFTVAVIPQDLYLASRANPAMALECHETVLRPLLQSATEVWVYGLKEGSRAMDAAKGMVKRQADKHLIAPDTPTDGDLIRGRESFWNAAGGQRGSVVLWLEPERFPAGIFAHCERAYVLNNPAAAHTPAAFQWVKTAVTSGTTVAAMLSCTNGMQWLSFHAAPSLLSPLFAQAVSQVQGGQATHEP